MARQLNVNLVFNANTQQARQQMAALQTSMNQVQTAFNSQISMNGLTTELSKAQSAIIALKTNLNNAFDVNTGKLDMSKFNQQMKMSGQTIQSYRIALQQIGPEGVRAFNQLSQSVMQAQMPIHQTKNLLTTMMDTFGSSIKWSLAYGAINKISQGFQDAFQYAQDLNQSLVDIRVVTGLGADEMVRFAEQANRAAKVLATTTTDYTKAALIYYQQGLEGKAVEERTETTLKLANVTGQTAEVVSDQMTAVWNNFYNGSKSLEYYADVLTALGAATASSTDEISQGLEKFAAVAETVGLSYEYATTALATVTAQTRQSADVVGTAFKTLFARIQDLELGETLDDGTTLGSYSEALYKVGVDIKDSQGNLKDMNDILDEMGAKWQQIDKDQQVALAKSVAGIRQYTQLIALMDNWDTFEMNLTVAETAEGTLQEQQEIWAESWEAAQTRVKAAGEDVYNSLIDDKFFIDLNNAFADLLSGLDDFIEAMGGLKTLIPLIGSLILKAFGPMALSAISGFTKGIMGPSKADIAAGQSTRLQIAQQQGVMARETSGAQGAALADMNKEQMAQLEAIEGLTRNISKQEAERLSYMQQENAELANEILRQAESVDLLERKNNELRQAHSFASMEKDMGFQGLMRTNDPTKLKALTDADNIMTNATNAEMSQQKFLATSYYNQDGSFNAKMATMDIEAMKGQAGFAGTFVEKFDTTNLSPERLSAFTKELKAMDISGTAAAKAGGMLTEAYGTEASADIAKYTQGMRKMSKASAEVTANGIRMTRMEENLGEELDKYSAKMKKAVAETNAMNKVPLGEAIIGMASGIGMAAAGMSMAVNGVQSALEMFKTGEHTLSGWLGILTSVGFALPMVANGFKSLATAVGINNLVTAASTALQKVNNEADKEGLALDSAAVLLKKQLTLEEMYGIGPKTAGLMLDEQGNLIKSKAIPIIIASTIAKKTEAAADSGNVIAKLAHAAANWVLTASMPPLLAITLILMAALVAIAAVIATVVAVVKGLSDAYNADAIAAEKAREEAKALAEAYNEVKQKFEELKQSITDYKDAQKAIDELKEGTQEWRDAVSEANIEILELLDKYPELAQYVQTLEGGRMIITDEGLAKIQAEQAQNVATMANVSASANLRAKQAELRAERTDLLRNTLTYNDTSMTINGVIGTAIGSGFGPMGTAVGAAIPALMETVQTAKMDTLLEELAEKYEKEGASAFIGLEEQLKALGVASDEAAEEVRNLIIEQQNLKDTEELLAQSQIDNILNSQSNFNSKSYGAGMQKVARELGEDMVADKNFSADSMHEYDKNNLWYQAPLAAVGYSAAGLGGLVIPAAMDAFGWYNETSTEIGDETFKKYLKAQGLSDDDVKSINFTKNGEVTYKQRKEEGSAEFDEKRISYEALADFAKQDYLAEHAAEIALAMNNLMATTRTLSMSNDATSQALASYLAEGDLSMMSPEVYEQLKGSSAEEITQIFDDNKAVFEAAGISSANELITGFDAALASYDPAQAQQNILNRQWENFRQTITAGAKELEISESTLKTYTEILIENNGALKDNMDIAGKTAVSHFKLAKGVEKVQKAISDNIGVLETGNTNSLEYAEALGEVRDAVAETFGMNVSASFVEENLSTIKSMADGSVEAFKNLQKLLVEDFVIGLQLEDNAKETLQSELDSLLNEVEGLEVKGTLSLDNTDAIAALNTALENGSATKEEIEAIFSNMNLAFPDTTITTYKKPTRTTTYTENTIWDGSTTKNTKTKSTVTSEIELPWIGDNPPQFKTDAFGAYTFNEQGEAEQIEGTGKSNAISGLSKTAEMSSNDLKQILNYDTDEKGETATDRKKRLKDLDNEVERYHEIDESIQNIERNLDRLSKAKDRAFGKSKLNIIEQEIEQQKELIALTEQRAKEAAKYYQEDKQYILDNYAVTIDSEGNISNYEDLIRGQIKKLRGIKDSESQEYKDAEQYLNQMKEDFAQYEESLKTLNDEQQNVIDRNYELQEQAMEKIEFAVQIKVDAADDDLARIDFLMQTIEDDAFKAADAINLLGESAAANESKYWAAKEGIEAVNAAFEAGDISAEQAAAQIRQYRDDMIDANAELLELRNTVQDTLTEGADAFNEKFDKNAEKFEFYNSVIENYKNIIDIVGKDTAGVSNELLNQMNSAAIKNANNQLSASRKKLEENEKFRAELEKERAAAAKKYGEESWQVEDWDKQIEYADEQIRAATEEFNDSWSSALELAADAFSAHIDTIVENFSEAVSGIAGTLDALQEAFDRQTEVNDRYLESYEKTYEINKLNRSIQDSIDKTDNIGSQKELRSLQQELLAMNEAGVQVSQRDIEYMQKKYDLMVAEQAFKDAQNAKSIVRLQRDSEGNFGYVYTADQNSVDNAQQNYEDKLYAIQKFGDESLQEISEQYIAVNKEFAEAITAINEDATLDQEERDKKLAETVEYYTGKLKYWTDEGKKFLQYGKDINVEYNTSMAENFHDTVIGSMYPDLEDFEELYLNSQSAMTQAGADFIKASKQYQTDIETVMANAGTSVEDFAKQAKKELDTVQKESRETAAAAKTIADEMSNKLNGEQGAIKAVSSFQSSYYQKMLDIREDTETTIGTIDTLLKKYEALAKAANEDYTPTDYSDEGTGDQNGDKNLGGNGKNNRITVTNKKGADSKDFIDAQGNTWHQGSNKLWYQAEQGWNGYKNEGLNGNTWTLSWDANTKGYSNEELAKLGKKYTIAKDGVKVVQGQTYYKIGEDWYNGKNLVLPNQGHSVSGDAVYLLPNAKPATLPKLPKEFSLTTGSGWNDATWFSRFNQDGSRPNFWTSAVDDHRPNQTLTITGRTKNKKSISLWNNAQHYLYQVKFDSGYTGWFAGLDLQQVDSKFTDRYIDENYDLPKFDTGGYTGSWGPEGRLAMLHQKEIVLNAHDTANLLTAVDIVRSMADKLEMNASLASQGIAGLTASIAPYHGGDTLEQNVTIHAEFPNATNHSEIEEAFGNLVNLASQYANRK